MTVSTDLPFPELIENPITKKLIFPVKAVVTRNNYTPAYCPGLIKFSETYSLSMRGLTLSQKDDVIAVLNVQDTGFVISWIPPTELAERLFYPPDSYKIVKKTRFRAGVSEDLYDILFELKNYY